MSIRINIGCGQTPTEGWRNYDNSLSIRLSGFPLIANIASKVGLLSKSQSEFITFARKSNIRWADATKHIPEKDNSVEVLYSSHMLEHLDKSEAKDFLKEARRILILGGTLRLAVPNLKYHIDNYQENQDADIFVENILLSKEQPKSFLEKIKYLVVGDRNHMWMYDSKSLCKLLTSEGFSSAKELEAGRTTISNPGALDLKERYPESVFVEAIKL